MKKIITLLPILFFGCSSQSVDIQIDKKNNEQIVSVECKNKYSFGNSEICIPTIEGFKECVSNKKVYNYLENFMVPGEVVLGLYMTNNAYNEVEISESLDFNEFYKLYSNEKLAETDANSQLLQQFSKISISNHLKTDWDNIKSNVESYFENVQVGQPVLLDSYEVNEHSKTNIIMSKTIIDGNTRIIISAANILIIDKKLLFFSYYDTYKGSSTIDSFKGRNDYALRLIFNSNE